MPPSKPKPPFGDSRTADQKLDDARAMKAQAEADTEAMGGVTPPAGPMSDRDRAARNSMIFRMSLRGTDVYDLSQIYELHPNTVQNIIRDQRRENQRLSQRPPIEVAEELIEQIDAGISEIAATAARETGSVRVTAVLGRINALIQKGKWLQSAGILPEKASEMHVIVEGEHMASNIMSVLERRGVLSPELLEEISVAMGKPIAIEAGAEEVQDAEEVPELEPPAPLK